MADAEVAILLVSANSLASRFINSHEVDPLLDAQSTRGVKIIPVLLRPVALPAKLECLNFVNQKRPVGGKAPEERDEVWVEVFEEVKATLG